MQIVRSENPGEQASKRLTEILENNSGRPTLLMLSGGSAFSILDFVLPEVLGPSITISVLDERFSTDSLVNNFVQLTQTKFYKLCIDKGVNFISTQVLEEDSMELLTERWGRALHDWKNNNPEGLVVATMGIGPDGHTVGIFAGDFGVDFNCDNWLIPYSVPSEVNEYKQRVTVSNTFLKKEVDEVVAYAVGDSKREIIERLLVKSISTTREMPVKVMKEMRKVTLYTDQG